MATYTAPPPGNKKTAPLICKKCGDRWPDGLYCRRCGADLIEPEPEKPQTKANILRVLIVAVPVAIWYLFFHHAPPPPEPQAKAIFPSQSNVVKQIVRIAASIKPITAQEIFDRSQPSIATLYSDDATGNATTVIGAAFLFEDSVLATNAHVVRGIPNISAHFSDGTILKVRNVLAKDDARDIALLRLTDTTISPLPLGSAGSVAPGDSIIGIGSPDGVGGSVAQGILKGSHAQMLQTNLPVRAAWSGGPVLTMKGEVIGLLTDQPQPGQPKDAHFALPIAWALDLLAKAGSANIGTPTAETAQSPGLHVATSLAAHGHSVTAFTTPANVETALLAVNFAPSDNSGADLHVKVMQGTHVVYDSGSSVDASFKLKLKHGSYTLIVENTASIPRQLRLEGSFAAAP